MKISVVCESTMNEDGIDCKAEYQQSGVECLSDLAYVFAEGARSIGFPYVTEVSIQTESGMEF